MTKATVNGVAFRVGTLPAWFPAGGITLEPIGVFIQKREMLIDQGLDVLAHEAVHVRDQRRWHVLWWLSYLGLGLGFLSLRGFWEWRAYRATLASVFERTGRVDLTTKNFVVRALSGPLYLWAMSRGHARRLVEEEAKRLEGRKP